MANGFNVSNISTYINQTGDLFYKSIVPETLFDSVKVQTGVKVKTAINILDMDLHLQAGNSCSYTPTGATYFKQRYLDPCVIAHHDKFCMRDLEPYWMAEKLAPGSSYMDLDFIQTDYLGLLGKKIAKAVQEIAWLGDTDSGTTYKSLCDGFVYQLKNDGGLHTTTGATTMTVANIVAQINIMILSIPAAIQGNALNIYLSHSLYNMFVQGWATAYSAAPFYLDNTKFTHPFYANITFKPQSGLEGTSYVIIGEKDNFVYGTDVQDEFSNTTFAPGAGSDSNIYVTSVWKQAQNIAFPDQVVANF